MSKRLQNWDEIGFNEFIDELKKVKVIFSIAEEVQWMEYFNNQKDKMQELITEIEHIDNEIDVMVYKLYNLTYDEVKIVDPEFWLSKEEYEKFEIEN